MSKNGKSIRLSQKHGVNPTVLKCFWCGGDMGIALLGKMKARDGDRDPEAPREMCMGIEPCDDCKAKMAKGVTVIEINGDGSRFGGNEAFAFKSPDGKLHWPSGRFAVLREGAEIVKDLKAGQRAFCDKKVMDMLLGTAHGKGEQE